MEGPAHRVDGAVSDSERTARLEAGRDALRRGAWAEAVAALTRVADVSAGASEAGAEAWAGIGLAWYWLGDATEATAAHESAFRLYRELGRPASAARMALWLADEHLAFFGGSAVANGWLEQAERLLSDLPPSVEHVWLLAYRGHYALDITGDARHALDLAREGQALARALDAPDAEVVTLALEGLALVVLGEVDTGMARLDEASAAAVTRGLTDLNAVAWACCYLVHGCKSIRDFTRAAEWCQRVMAFCQRWGLAPVYETCRIDYATVLTWRGQWDTAETELQRAADGARGGSPVLERVRNVRLGELRRRQGRLEEAESLFGQAGEDLLATVGRAAVALDRGEPAVALDLSGRVLRLLPPEAWTDRVDALLIRIRAAAALGDGARAAEDTLELATVAERVRTEPLQAAAAYARGVVAAEGGDPAAAAHAFEEAVVHGDRGGAPYETAQARLELAVALARLGRHATARREAARCKDSFESLGAVRDVARVDAFLRRLPAPAVEARGPLTGRELEILGLIARGCSNRLIAAELCLSPHTVKRHVANILRKLGCPSRAAAVAHVSRLGLLS